LPSVVVVDTSFDLLELPHLRSALCPTHVITNHSDDAGTASEKQPYVRSRCDLLVTVMLVET